jgi:hypothetical protein
MLLRARATLRKKILLAMVTSRLGGLNLFYNTLTKSQLFEWRDRTLASPPAAHTLSRKRTLFELFEIGDRPAGEDMMRLGRPSCLLFFHIRVEMRAQQSQGMHPDAYMRAWHNAEKRQRAENLVYLFSAQSCVINVVGTISTHLWLAIAQHKTSKDKTTL